MCTSQKWNLVATPVENFVPSLVLIDLSSSSMPSTRPWYCEILRLLICFREKRSIFRWWSTQRPRLPFEYVGRNSVNGWLGVAVGAFYRSTLMIFLLEYLIQPWISCCRAISRTCLKIATQESVGIDRGTPCYCRDCVLFSLVLAVRIGMFHESTSGVQLSRSSSIQN